MTTLCLLHAHSTSIPLPLTDGEDGPRIFLICPGRYDPKKYDIVDVIKYYVLLTDLLLMEDDNFIVSGQVGILDLTNVGWEHFVQFKPQFVKKMTLLSQDSSPFRPAGFHYVNTPDGFEYVFNMFKTFMSEENKKLVRDETTQYEFLMKLLFSSLFDSCMYMATILNRCTSMCPNDFYQPNTVVRPEQFKVSSTNGKRSCWTGVKSWLNGKNTVQTNYCD